MSLLTASCPNPFRLGVLLLIGIPIFMASWPLQVPSDTKLGFRALNHTKYDEAERIFRKALAQAETRGANDPAVAIGLVNLALVYDQQHKHARAECLLRRSLAIWDNSRNVDRQELATTLNNLAMACHKQGKDIEAEPLFQRNLVVSKEAFGIDHSRTLFMMENVEDFYQDTQRWAMVECLCRSELAIIKERRNPCCPRMESRLAKLGNACWQQDKFEEARSLFEEEFFVSKKMFEERLALQGQKVGSHDRSLDSFGDTNMAGALYAIGLVWESQGNKDEATRFFKRAKALDKTIGVLPKWPQQLHSD
jgi:tetratricopeptide (TPR) repeat protein